ETPPSTPPSARTPEGGMVPDRPSHPPWSPSDAVDACRHAVEVEPPRAAPVFITARIRAGECCSASRAEPRLRLSTCHRRRRRALPTRRWSRRLAFECRAELLGELVEIVSDADSTPSSPAAPRGAVAAKRDEARNRTPGAGDDDLLTGFHTIKKLLEVGGSVGSGDVTHGR